jgi:hypothetical protein
MDRVLIHLAVPDEKRALAGTMAELSGMPTEHSIKLIATPGMASDEWNAANGQTSDWWGASQFVEASAAQTMMASGYALQTQSWFAAYDEASRALIQHNLPQPPVNPSFAAFLQAAGLDIQASIP